MTLAAAFLFFGLALVLPGALQWAIAHEFGDRTAANLRRLGFVVAAERWTPERGQRLSRRAAVVWWALSAACLVTACVLLAIGGDLGAA